MRNKLATLILATTMFATASQAATIIDTGAPAGNSGALISGPGTNASYGALFTVAGDTVLDSVTAYFNSSSNATATATIAQNTNGLPGVSLFSTGFNLTSTSGRAAFTSAFGANVLTTGSYFILFSGMTSANSFLSLSIGAPDPSPTEVFIDERFTTYRSTNAGFAFNIQGTPVTATAVPEPASWAMMLGGFALVGGAMRVRRRRVVMAI